MSEAQCKAAACMGGCLADIVVDNVRETAEVVIKLAVNDLLTDEQLEAVIDIATRFELEIKRRREADENLKKLLLRAIPDITA